MERETLTTVSGAARRLNVSADTIRRLHDGGQLPGVRMETGERVFRVADIERLAIQRATQQNRRGGK